MHECQGIFYQCVHCTALCSGQAQFLRKQHAVFGMKHISKPIQQVLQGFFAVRNQGAECLSQCIQVPMRNTGLVAVAVTALVVGMIADVVNIEAIHEAIGAVVYGQAQ